MKKQRCYTSLSIGLLSLIVFAACSRVDSATEKANGSKKSSSTSDIELLEEKPEVAKVKRSNQPNRIVANFNGDTKTEMGFNWYTTDKFDDASVWVSTSKDMADAQAFEAKAERVTSRYGQRDKEGNFIYADIKRDKEGEVVEKNGKAEINGYYTDKEITADNKDWTSGDNIGSLDLEDVTEYSYKAKASGLQPDTTYYYQVGSEKGDVSGTGTFTTSGENGDEFKFVHYTDTQNAYWNENVRNEADFGADTIKQALETAGDANFVLHTGDIVEIAEVEDEWQDIYGKSEEFWMKQPLAMVPGNHDEYALNEDDDLLTEIYNQHVNVPAENNAKDGGSYYSYDYNGVHFVVANTNDNKKSKDNPEEKALGKKQMDWIEKDIKEARSNGTNWVVMTYHKPLFSRSYHSLEDEDVQAVREEFMEQIDELDVDLALQGHDHVSSRTEPLNYLPTNESFSNAKIDEADKIKKEGTEYYQSPEGTVFVLPNNGGTKAYDDIYSKGVQHVHSVRPELDWLTQNDIDYWNSLFAYGTQPQNSTEFDDSHENARDSSTQNFAVYDVKNDELGVKIYQINGDLAKDENREVELVHEFGIDKN
ncbi:serine/threonine protein phosphatase [Tetragenococcus halophilus]|uniref:Serine/threonine protein phosphatase n=1 Tax=Tetragenococcus halophilus TaxID=51669 RepID=A0A3G5FHP5_TETHA|nr:metallophosphoesterase family protein [Tetragenococcus halophilus]AYW49801.1 serine/threonine protein phosphatase [Tetragenococcus halophilus]GBD64512.1 hypothetical protein TEHD23766T_1939 [Tetragenococcus halophilus subsp. flandriensis]